MTKTKMSTVAIVTLSVLLAAALAATIVLAAFAFTAKANTTFNFASGVSVEATSGLTDAGVWKANLVTKKGEISTELTESTNKDITQGVALQPVTIKNTSGQTITIAVAVVISGTSNPNLYVGTTSAVGSTTKLADSKATTANFDAGTTAYKSVKINKAEDKDSLQWATYTLEKDGSVTVNNYINTGYDESAIDALDGKDFTATMYFAAVYSSQDISAAIESADITSTSWKVSAKA